MKIIDTHCHLYSEEFKDDLKDIIQRAEVEGVEKFYMPAIDSNSLPAMLKLEEEYPGKCFAMMGLHPCYVKENYKDELNVVESWIQKRKFVAIGEIGLDFYWDKTFTPQQYEAFKIQIDWALQYKTPIVIHSRNAMAETIGIIKEYAPKGLKGVFHCFSGNYENAKEIIDAGFYLGIGGVITYKNAGLAEVIKKISVDHIVLETDAPYLAPVPFRGKRNESSYLKYIIDQIALVKMIDKEEISEIVTQNTKKIFGF